MPARQYHEIPTQLLQEIAAVENLPLLSGSPFQSTQAQSTDSIFNAQLGVRVCDEAWRDRVHDN